MFQQKELVATLKRPASATLGDFILPNDDPRVLGGRARMTAESLVNDNVGTGRVDWTRCETYHQLARSLEGLGDRRPLTDWTDSGSTGMPSYCWNDWANAQVHRIHDLIDISTLRLAQAGLDCTYLDTVWNLSQDVGRDTIGTFGLCQCLTPSGVPYVSSRGGPLVGEELLMLQGIPAHDLLLTKEMESNLKDLAGNAMSTTVVGACIAAALLVGYDTLPSRTLPGASKSTRLVPRPLTSPSSIEFSQDFGQYKGIDVNLSPSWLTSNTRRTFLDRANKSRRMCTSEGPDESIPLNLIVQCRECGHTSCTANAVPPRKFEKHVYGPVDDMDCRIEPTAFRHELLALLPMRLVIRGFDATKIEKPDNVDTSLWAAWLDLATEAVMTTLESPSEFRFRRVVCTHIWTALYGNQTKAHLEARISKLGVMWYLFSKRPLDIGAQLVELPIARLIVKPRTERFVLTDGTWELCLPVTTKVPITIASIEERVPSWRNRLGLKGRFEEEMESEKLCITVDSDNNEMLDLKSEIDGCYKLLPDCGGACGSLRKKEGCGGEGMFFFLSAGRTSQAKDNDYVLSPSCHRTIRGEYRAVSLHFERDFNPLGSVNETLHDSDARAVSAFKHGKWVPLLNLETDMSSNDAMDVVKPNGELVVPFSRSGDKTYPVVLDCKFSVRDDDDFFIRCGKRGGGCAELNLMKSNAILDDLAFATSRLRLPKSAESGAWSELKLEDGLSLHTNEKDWICRECSPVKPGLHWILTTKGNRKAYVPVEDGKEAAAYERALKARPQPWLFRLALLPGDNSFRGCDAQLSISIGFNPCSLAQRSFGWFPSLTLARNSWVDVALKSTSLSRLDCIFDWRLVQHTESAFTGFAPLRIPSNEHNDQAEQPPHFKTYPLWQAQLRLLQWMLDQESTSEPVFEEEVTEDVLPGLCWRAEGRARRPVLVRGGIIADAVGYGKTAITLALIDASTVKSRAPVEIPSFYRHGFISTKATLIVVPKHLIGHWPDEIDKFLGNSKSVVVVKDLSAWQRLKICQVVNADIVLVSFDVPMHEKYLATLAMLSGFDQDHLPRGAGGGRHFRFVYKSCLEALPERVAQICEDRTRAVSRKNHTKTKSAVGMNTTGATSKVSKTAAATRDPWGLSNKETLEDFTQMACPPLEMFFWNRLVVDEFTYLTKKKDRERLLEFTYNLKSSFRWFLSGTPDHSDFNDVNNLARLLGIHLGIDELLPGVKLSKKYLSDRESTGLESLSLYLESRSLAWHHRRHGLCQAFLDRFVRKNHAEIDGIGYKETPVHIDLSAPERAIYIELESLVENLETNNKNGSIGQRKNCGDRQTRMDMILQSSQSGEEALLKCSSHYNICGSSTAAETLDDIIHDRQEEKGNLERALTESLVVAFKKRSFILSHQPNWLGSVREGPGDESDALARYLRLVSKESVFLRADNEIDELVHRVARRAKEVYDGLSVTVTAKKRKSTGKDTKELYTMKKELRTHMHTVHALCKELSNRIRSLRYVENIGKVHQNACQWACFGCNKEKMNSNIAFGVLTCCGHYGCMECLERQASTGRCVVTDCCAHVRTAHIVATDRLALDASGASGASTEQFGRKLTSLINKVKEIVNDCRDRLIVFCQFDDLMGKVKEALTANGIDALDASGDAVAIFQKVVLDATDPHVLLLKMDDEQSSGLNLTNLNHALFVHAVSAESQEAYDACEAQAIGRIRRPGQQKTVHFWRFLATDTIDTKIYHQRTLAANVSS